MSLELDRLSPVGVFEVPGERDAAFLEFCLGCRKVNNLNARPDVLVASPPALVGRVGVPLEQFTAQSTSIALDRRVLPSSYGDKV